MSFLFVCSWELIFVVLSSQAEAWAWALFYAGVTGVAFGSAYYHLKPDNNRVLWDTLPVSITITHVSI